MLGYTGRMDTKTAQQLNELNKDFYARVHDSFSATRRSPWKGWDRVRELAAQSLGARLDVLDLACGNLRFEEYLRSGFDSVRTWAVDNTVELAAHGNAEDVRFQQLDVVQTLLDGTDLAPAIDAPACDLAVCFGFMHHIALPRHRAEVLRALVSHTRPGGLVAVSFWQFARSPRLLAKATPLEDEGDYLLGWQENASVKRYCHSFSDGEVDELVRQVQGTACELERYHADGKTNDLNCYVILGVS